MRRYPILIAALFLSFTVNAQLKTYVVPEAGPTWDISRVDDTGAYFEQSVIQGSTFGLGIWQEIMPGFSIGSGAYYHYYSSGINPVDKRPHQSSIKSYRSILIPLRASFRIQPEELLISFTPRIGYQLGFLLDAPVTQAPASYFSNRDGVAVSYALTESVDSDVNMIQLIEAGLSIDYRFENNWQVGMSLISYSGVKTLKSSTIQYQTSEGESISALYTDNGDRFEVMFNAGIPISNIWHNRDLRLHQSIEGGTWKGKPVNVTTYLYWGAEFGALWRGFNTTNPAIGARPLSGRGIFRYSNMHTGLMGGYKFSSTAAIDIGAYFQRSTTFFALMYDHEVDFVTKVRSPFYLEFPVNLRYYYDLYKGVVHAVPFLGFGVMTHFSGAGHTSGSGNFEFSTPTGSSNGSFSYSSDRVVRFGYLVQAGMKAEVLLPIPFPTIGFWGVTYKHGIRDINQIEVTTNIGETPAQSVVGYAGSGWLLDFGVKFPMIFNSDDRFRRRHPHGR